MGPSVQVRLTFSFFAMLQQSNLGLSSSSHFDLSRHTCRGDIISAPLGLIILVKWTKTHQSVGMALVLLIPEVPGHPADPVKAYCMLILSSPTASPNQSLLTFLKDNHRITVTAVMLTRTLSVMLDALGLDPTLYSLHSLQCGDAMAAYREGLDHAGRHQEAWFVGK